MRNHILENMVLHERKGAAGEQSSYVGYLRFEDSTGKVRIIKATTTTCTREEALIMMRVSLSLAVNAAAHKKFDAFIPKGTARPYFLIDASGHGTTAIGDMTCWGLGTYTRGGSIALIGTDRVRSGLWEVPPHKLGSSYAFDLLYRNDRCGTWDKLKPKGNIVKSALVKAARPVQALASLYTRTGNATIANKAAELLGYSREIDYIDGQDREWEEMLKHVKYTPDVQARVLRSWIEGTPTPTWDAIVAA